MGKWNINGPEQPPAKDKGKDSGTPKKSAEGFRGKSGELAGSGQQASKKRPPQKL